MQYLKKSVQEKILSSALIEFKEHGYLEASVRDIAAGAGIALGSIYRYFDNKEALFDALIYPVYSRIFKYLSKMRIEIEKLPCESNTEDTVSDMLNVIVEMVKESNTEITIIFDKSKGSKYENVKKELVDLIYSMNLQSFKDDVEKDENNKKILRIFCYSFVEGISLIFKENSDGDTVKLLVNKLIYLFYKDAYQRVGHSY